MEFTRLKGIAASPGIAAGEVWLTERVVFTSFKESILPGQVDSDADLTAGQMIFSQSGSPTDAAALWERAASTWRNQHPDELTNWKNWQQ